MIEQIKTKVFSLKIKENIKLHLSESEILFLGTTIDSEILEKVNTYIVKEVQPYKVNKVIRRFYDTKQKMGFDSFEECLEYFIEKDEFFNGPNRVDRIDDFIEALYNEKQLSNKIKDENDDRIEAGLI